MAQLHMHKGEPFSCHNVYPDAGLSLLHYGLLRDITPEAGGECDT